MTPPGRRFDHTLIYGATAIFKSQSSRLKKVHLGRKGVPATSNHGTKIVLTSSATEMSDYANNPFVAFVAAFAKGPLPLWILRKALYPPVETASDGQAKYAPYGLRRVESILLGNGFEDSDVAVVHPSNLHNFVGPETRVIGISTMDPQGLAYVSKTYSSLIGGGKPMNAIEFEALMEIPCLRNSKARIIVGGYGSWQLDRAKVVEKYGIDSVLLGGDPNTIVKVFEAAASEKPLPRIIRCANSSNEMEMPLIRHAAIHGGIEISRGCGRNCQFCTPTMQHKYDVPLDSILSEVQTTIGEGCSKITLITEDLFLYGARDSRFTPNSETVLKLVRSVADHPGVTAVQPSHMSLAPVVYDPGLVRKVAEILIERSWYNHDGKPIVTSETGIETGSTRLMKKYMAGKPLPFRPEQWKNVVSEAFGILNDNDWYPLATLIVGLPGEREEDVVETLELMDTLKDFKAFYVPLFFVPLENCILMSKSGTELDSLSRARWDFLTRCWQYNIRIWRDTFLENRITNPLLYKLVRKMLIPYAAKVAGIYYGRKYGGAMEEAIWKMAMA